MLTRQSDILAAAAMRAIFGNRIQNAFIADICDLSIGVGLTADIAHLRQIDRMTCRTGVSHTVLAPLIDIEAKLQRSSHRDACRPAGHVSNARIMSVHPIRSTLPTLFPTVAPVGGMARGKRTARNTSWWVGGDSADDGAEIPEIPSVQGAPCEMIHVQTGQEKRGR